MRGFDLRAFEAGLISIRPDMKPMRDKSLLKDGIRLFYEIGFKRNSDLGIIGGNWIRTGKFKEVTNWKEVLKREPLFDNIEYLEHHNFMII